MQFADFYFLITADEVSLFSIYRCPERIFVFLHTVIISLLKFKKENFKILDDKVLHFNKNTFLFDFITGG